jgi:hypothetical protein
MGQTGAYSFKLSADAVDNGRQPCHPFAGKRPAGESRRLAAPEDRGAREPDATAWRRYPVQIGFWEDIL